MCLSGLTCPKTEAKGQGPKAMYHCVIYDFYVVSLKVESRRLEDRRPKWNNLSEPKWSKCLSGKYSQKTLGKRNKTAA